MERLDPYRDIDLVEAGNTVALESVALVPDVASAASGVTAAYAAFVAYANLGRFVVYLS